MAEKAGSNKDKLIVALLAESMKDAEKMVKLLRDDVKTFEVGAPTYTSLGPDVIKMIHDNGCKVYLDLKYHDIPSTVAKAVGAATKLGVSMLDVHAAGGHDMLVRTVEAAQFAAGSKSKMPLLFAVTVLTSMESLGDIGVQFEVREQVVRFAKMAKESGLHGVLASPLEIKPIRKACGEKFLVMTSGVRPIGSAAQDQRRISSPIMAIAAGANYIVIGRPVYQSKDPKAVVKQILKEIE
ncbi:MAG TPA: orotidine-5'-phosphate decarboxylase [bacterium]|nr:orotidine-5'-phosphate decarboxylase [Myxococcales bacterium]OQA60805.1 MAG: Orotidine 5'-phosphate decarboxylase [bacterium ADurb.Bin270]HPW45399.1 orotidine-5'-phosphate decarboxylase [bacterium]HQC50974.1 orotidine-5'-phosphate decarboxylase [bacterium]HQG13047.1 orotidine-5'-phosphate decarboxylase [bacterium]